MSAPEEEIRLPGSIARAIEAHAQARAPEEVCGFLGGAHGRATVFLPVENLLHSPAAFRMEPGAQFEALRDLQRQGLDVLAVFHSHPAGPETLSESDLREHYDPAALALVAARASGGWRLAAFRVRGAAAEPVRVRVEPD